MDCPFCKESRRDLFGLSLHIDDAHAEQRAGMRLMVETAPLPILEIDIDAIYAKRPDLVRQAPEGGHALQ